MRTLTKFYTLCILLSSMAFSACHDTEQERLAQIESLKATQDAITQANHNNKIELLKTELTVQSQQLPLAKELAQLPKDNPLAVLVADSTASLPKIDSTILNQRTNIVVENAAMMISVRDYEQAKQKVYNFAAQYEAILVSQQEEFQQYQIANTFHIQVPTKNYNYLVDAFKDMAMVLREKRTWKEDLSVNWADVYARLEAKQEAKQRLQDLIKKADKASDILPIQQQLDALLEEIQVLNRMTQTLQQKTLYASIVLTIYQQINQQPEQVAAFSDRVQENAIKGLDHFKNTIINLSTYWIYIVLGTVFLIIFSLAKRKAKKNIENDNHWEN